ncbi:elongation factor 1-gamma [Cylindrobasidium torrendii FP15055 ss-10]|uniref:Elongation factor 1-gamma n=1 Tax=Cylindrobasidium torrendii FP15055 ss-10 TaxID=1314674 RepID=A0A0D7BME3_9AGAR|nr:elongation factor 1-gamma [Cylindrobasidium torrendii FP15055 ss-10]
MSTPTFYALDHQPFSKAIRAVCTLSGIPFKAPSGYEHFKTNKEAAFRAKFPHGKIPAWEEDDFFLSEGDSILRYVASKAPNGDFYGNSTKEAALIDQFIHLADSEVFASSIQIYFVCYGVIPYSKPAQTLFFERQARALRTLELRLASRTFLVGERITAADLYIAAVMQHSVHNTIGKAASSQYPSLVRHLETIANQPQLKDIFGVTEYTDNRLFAFVPPKKDDKKKEPKAEKKKEDKPKAAKKPKQEEEDDDEPPADVPPEEKKRNPLDDLPKSTFNLEDWKRAYSNLDTRGADGSLEWFYKNYDPSGFSVWRVDFKYNDELTQTFMSSNQIGGFFNRLEASRKYLFASAGVLGETNNSVISGTIITRGPEIEPTISVAPDWESYAYAKLDLSNEDDKKFFEAALAWDLQIDGKAWADGKNFK